MPLTDDIDWSDPIAANRLLRMKLAELEATQGNGAGNNRQQFYNDRDEYGDDDEYYEEERHAPPPQPQQKSSRPHEKKTKNVKRRDKPGTSFRVNRTFDNNRCKEIDRGNLNLVKRLASV